MSFSQFMQILMDAAGQLFYSISVAMGIMIAYGSYVKKDVNLGESVNQIEFFDTLNIAPSTASMFSKRFIFYIKKLFYLSLQIS